jgi:hypothetical protein
VGEPSRGHGLIAGTLDDKVDRVVAFGLLDSTGAFRSLGVPSGGRMWGAVPGWLSDGRDLVARLVAGVAVIDAATSQWRVVAPAGPNDYLSLNRDGRALSVEREVLDSDIWLVEFP